MVPPNSDLMPLMEDMQLTAREMLIAKMAASMAADMAVKKMTDNFYKEVGKGIVSKWLIIIGAMVVAFGAGKGWVNPFK